MDLKFHVVGLDDPPGEIDLLRLEQFAARFRAAIMASAKAELNVAAYRRTLPDEDPPRFRLADLTKGSTTLQVRSTDERPLTIQSATRHLDAVRTFIRDGGWPTYVLPGERQAWGAMYRGLAGRQSVIVEVSVDGVAQARMEPSLVAALEQADLSPRFEHVEIVGELHLIEWANDPHFNIRTSDNDLRFALLPEFEDVIDGLRWKRVLARAQVEIGTNRARLLEEPVLTNETARLTVVSEVAVPGWVSKQLGRIHGFASLAPGWRGPQSRAIAANQRDAADELTRRIHEQFGSRIGDRRGPYFVPSAYGHLEFEWRVDDRELICELHGAKYELMARRGSEEQFDGAVDQRELFEWIRWLLDGPESERGT